MGGYQSRGGDFGNAQELIALEKYGLQYSPDIVLLQIFPLNDICNNSVQLFGLCKSPNDPYRPYFIERNGKLVQTSAQPFRNWLRQYSSTYGLLELAWLRYLSPPADPTDEKMRKEGMRRLGMNPVDPLLLTYSVDEERPPIIEEAWETTERIIEEIHRTTIDNGAKLIAVVIPFEARVGDRWRDFENGRPERMVQDYPEQRLGKLFDRLKVPCVMMKPVFEEKIDQFLPTRAGHMNPQAHRMVSEAVFKKLVESGLAN